MYGIIYCTTNLVNGMKYIGQTKCTRRDFDTYLGSGKYLTNAIKKYGPENFIRETLCEAQDPEDLNELEEYYIDYYGAVESDLFYNLVRNANPPPTSKPVLVYDLNGNFVNKYSSAVECGLSLNISPSQVTHCLRNKGLSAGGYQYRNYKDPYPKKVKPYKYKGKPILVYNIYGEFIAKYTSAMQVEKHLNLPKMSVSQCIIRRNGFYKKNNLFFFCEENFDMKISQNIISEYRDKMVSRQQHKKKKITNNLNAKSKPVVIKDLMGNCLGYFDSISQASKIVGIPRTTLGAIANGIINKSSLVECYFK